MNINAEIAKASLIMARYHVPDEQQIAVVKILVDAGVEKCLDEQQRIREQGAALVQRAYAGTAQEKFDA